MEKIKGQKEMSIKKINILFTVFFAKMYLSTDFESVIKKRIRDVIDFHYLVSLGYISPMDFEIDLGSRYMPWLIYATLS